MSREPMFAGPGAALHSPQWFRVARLRPQLDPGTVVGRQVVRHRVWRTLARADGTRSLRLNLATWAWVGRCDGHVTVQQLWEAALQQLRDAAPTQDEVLDALSRLHAAGLLSFDRAPDFGAEGGAAAAAGAMTPPSRRQSWLAWRIPLGHPDAALARWAAKSRPWLMAPALWALAAMALLALLLGSIANAGELSAAAQALAASPRALLLGLAVFPLIKLWHEAAHGIIARLHGVPVPEWGLSLLMFMPVPYVDVSAASTLPRAGQRMAVAGAGIAAELLVAALALPVALGVQPGWVRDAALTAFFIGAVSTVAVNANPLLRFDGYHMLCDACGLPNLATRSHRWWAEHMRRWAFGTDAARSTLQMAPGEAPWLVAYAPAAALMRWAVALAVVWWLAGLSFALGLGVAAAFGFALVGKPIWAAWQAWQQAPLAAVRRPRAALRLGAFALGLVLAVGVVPLPDSTVVRGVWWLPEPALVRTGIDGFVAELLVEPGAAVEPGRPLVRLHAPALEAERGRLAARIAALQAEHWQALSDDAARAVQLEHELRATQADLARVDEQLGQRLVRAQVAGRLAIDRAADLPGRWLARGTLVAHVAGDSPGLVQVAVPHEQAALLAGAEHRVELRRASAPHASLLGLWDGQASGGGARLPSAALGERSGGSIPTDPADNDGLRPAQAVVLASIRLDPAAAGHQGPIPQAERIGERVWVRFRHGWSPLAAQAARALQQLVLRHFNPAR